MNLIWLLSYATTLLGCELPEPYASIKIAPYDLRDDWYQNLNEIEKLFEENNIQTVVEIGSYCGRSTIHMASLLPEHGTIYSVDTFEPDESYHKRSPISKDSAKLYTQFLSNVVHAGVSQKVVSLKMSSICASKMLKVKPDLVYIDGDHSYEAVYADLCAWYPFVKGHGILCGDDWQYKNRVRKAVIRFAEENDLEIVTDGHKFWRLVER